MTIETRSALAAALAPLASFPAAVGAAVVYFFQTQITGAGEPLTEALSAWLLFGVVGTLVAYLWMAVAGLPAALLALRFGFPRLWVALPVGAAIGLAVLFVGSRGSLLGGALMVYFGLANSAAFVWIFRAHARWLRSLPPPRVSPNH